MGKLRIDMKENKIYYLVAWSDDRSTSYNWVSIDGEGKLVSYDYEMMAFDDPVDIEQLLKNEKN